MGSFEPAWSSPLFNSTLLLNKKILIVEDEGLVAMDLAATVEDAGGNVVGPAHSLEIALEIINNKAQSDQIDYAILDINLGGITVFPAARLCVKRRIPFLFHSAQLGFSEFISEFPNVPICLKPCDPGKIIDVIAQQLLRESY